MTLAELDESFDRKIAMIMQSFLANQLDQAEYEIELSVLGEWYDKELAKIQDRALK